jgi:hypothetical protein
MPRKARKKLKFTEESLNEYVQELYDDSFAMKSKINILFKTWEAKVKDGGDIAAMGDTIVKVIGAMAKNQDQRLVILKYLKEIVMENKSLNDDEESESGNLTRDELIKLAQETVEGLKNEK